MHTLTLAEPAYSSWSMRIGLLIDRFDLPVRIEWVTFYSEPTLTEQIGHPPARTVPFLLCDDGTEVRESLAIAEELADRFPDAALWPCEPVLRGLARSLASEMHAGFVALRNQCPMALRVAYSDVPVDDALAADLALLEEIWADALDRSGGPWLAGDYSVADAFFAPVAARVAGYGLLVGDRAAAYVAQHLSDPAFMRWRALGLNKGEDRHETVYHRNYPRVAWPGPE
ncbi:glutathione S-transferase [Palleronia sp. THAF1]|uniref:glutathione S-transferase n=1 Tax=Palleronia sp. THAF1 TaxID=2587842 RepID=UPI000F53DF1C|nr:glutathione S-transferase [Palleronia sp. THAF1]